MSEASRNPETFDASEDALAEYNHYIDGLYRDGIEARESHSNVLNAQIVALDRVYSGLTRIANDSGIAPCPSCGCAVGAHVVSSPLSGPSAWCAEHRMVCA